MINGISTGSPLAVIIPTLRLCTVSGPLVAVSGQEGSPWAVYTRQPSYYIYFNVSVSGRSKGVVAIFGCGFPTPWV